MADVVSLRANQQDVDRFREFCKENNLSSALAFESILDIAETEIAKGKIVNREKEIEEFQLHVHSINRAFISSLEINENAENRVRVEFAKQLDSQLDTIADLRSKLKQAEDEKVATLEMSREMVEKSKETVLNAEAERSKVDKLNTDLSNELERLKEQIATDKEIISVLKSYEEDARNFKQSKIDNDELKNTIVELKDNIKDKDNSHVLQMKEIELKHSQEIAGIKANMQSTIASKELELSNYKNEADHKYFEMQQKYNEELNNLKSNIKDLINENEKIKDQNKDLINEIEKLKEKLAKQEDKEEKKPSPDEEGEQLSLL